MKKLTLNSSEKEILDYLGLGVGRLEHLWFEAKKEDLKKIINYCSIRDLDFCLEDDFDIYFSDNFEKVGINNYYGFTVMKEKTTYEYFIAIRAKFIGDYVEQIGQHRECFNSKEKALETAHKLWFTNDYNIVLIEHKINGYGEVIDIKTEIVK
jgi:hypothetical protein